MRERERKRERVVVRDLLGNARNIYLVLPSRYLTISKWPNLAAIKKKRKDRVITKEIKNKHVNRNQSPDLV
jgi:hypothetical protein